MIVTNGNRFNFFRSKSNVNDNIFDFGLLKSQIFFLFLIILLYECTVGQVVSAVALEGIWMS